MVEPSVELIIEQVKLAEIEQIEFESFVEIAKGNQATNLSFMILLEQGIKAHSCLHHRVSFAPTQSLYLPRDFFCP